jgi:TM2 domain-containing membrane protein YozV
MRNARLVATFHRPIPWRLAAAAACGWDHLLVDEDDPEKRIAELEGQLADSMNPPDQQQAASLKAAGWYPDPGGAALLRYWDGHEWTSATDIPPDVDTAAPAAEPESFAGPQWSEPPGQAPAPAYPSYPQPSPPPVEPTSDKKAVVAGTLQLLLGVLGVGRFYIGSWTIGACQLGLTILAVVLAGLVPQTADTAVTMIGFLLIAMPIWAFLDAILMFLGLITDGQGRKLS